MISSTTSASRTTPAGAPSLLAASRCDVEPGRDRRGARRERVGQVHARAARERAAAAATPARSPSTASTPRDAARVARHARARRRRLPEPRRPDRRRPSSRRTSRSVPRTWACRASEIRDAGDEALAAVGLAGLERREPHLLSGGPEAAAGRRGRPRDAARVPRARRADRDARPARAGATCSAIVERLGPRGHGHPARHARPGRGRRVPTGGRARRAARSSSTGAPAELLARAHELLDACGLELPPFARARGARCASSASASPSGDARRRGAGGGAVALT